MFTPEHYMTRSQDLEEAYHDAGQFYWENINIQSSEIIFSKDSIPIILPRHLVQDIDTLEDWNRAEKLYEIYLFEGRLANRGKTVDYHNKKD